MLKLGYNGGAFFSVFGTEREVSYFFSALLKIKEGYKIGQLSGYEEKAILSICDQVEAATKKRA